MTDDHPQVNALIVDCRDPDRLAAFWAELLGRPVVGRMGPYIFLERENGLGIGFQKVAEPKAGKNRIHLDLATADPAAEQRRIESLGGRRLGDYEDGGFLVMADPEGNEFCLIPQGSFEVDDDGRTDYTTTDQKSLGRV